MNEREKERKREKKKERKKEKTVKKDRFRWNLSIFHWCVDTNQRGYKSVRIHKATPIHARMYLAEKAKKNFQKKISKKNFQKKISKKKFLFFRAP